MIGAPVYSNMSMPTLNMKRSIYMERRERDYLDLGYVRRQRLFGIRVYDVWFSFFLTSFSENLAVGRI